MNLYTLKSVTKKYGVGDGLVIALDDVSTTIESGKFVVILGASGSGKSTLLNILGGIDHPSSGEILYQEENIAYLNNRKLTAFRQKNIGFIFQHYNLLNNLTALENIEFSCEISGQNKKLAKDALERVGLDQRGGHYPSELSGGEQQRISIARAIVKKPSVLLCDEPTGALDLKTGVSILETLRNVNKDDGSTVIVVTHNKDVARIADIVITMRDGQIISKDQIYNPVLPQDVEW